VLSRPAALGARPVVVGPDDLVEKAVAAEHLVERKLAVVRLAVVDVQVEGATACEQATRVLEPGHQEGQVVVEMVRVGGLGQHARAVAPPPEAGAVASAPLFRRGRERAPSLAPARVEGGIDVDELEALVGEGLQHREVVAEDHLVMDGAAQRHRCGRS